METTTTRPPARLTAAEYADFAERAGVERIDWREFIRRADRLGYRVETRWPCNCIAQLSLVPDPCSPFVPGDSWPETTYDATHKASGLSFAHIEAPRDTLAAFQELRRSTVCVSAGRIRSV